MRKLEPRTRRETLFAVEQTQQLFETIRKGEGRRSQCDQMGRLFVQLLVIYNYENMPNRIYNLLKQI